MQCKLTQRRAGPVPLERSRKPLDPYPVGVKTITPITCIPSRWHWRVHIELPVPSAGEMFKEGGLPDAKLREERLVCEISDALIMSFQLLQVGWLLPQQLKLHEYEAAIWLQRRSGVEHCSRHICDHGQPGCGLQVLRPERTRTRGEEEVCVIDEKTASNVWGQKPWKEGFD